MARTRSPASNRIRSGMCLGRVALTEPPACRSVTSFVMIASSTIVLQQACPTRCSLPFHMNEARVALNRRHFLACLSAMGLGSTLMPEALTIAAQGADIVTIDVLEAAQKIAGVS